MAVDFSHLPDESVCRAKPPSRLLWSIVFLILSLAGALLGVVLWPKHLPTQTPKFWVTLVLFPVGIAGIVVMCRWRIYEAQKLSVDLHNEVAQDYKQNVFRAASVPLTLVDSAYRFSVDAEMNDFRKIESNALSLASQTQAARGASPVKARWLATANMHDYAKSREGDRKRQMQITQWLFDQLLDALSARIQAVPSDMPLVILLGISGVLTYEENQRLWWASWHARSLRSAQRIAPAASAGTADLSMLDQWLDDTLEGSRQHVTLFVSVQLLSLLEADPPSGMAEAAVALLLMPDALAQQYKGPRQAVLHRPVRAGLNKPNDALARATAWADVTVPEIGAAWECQLDETRIGPLRQAANQLQLAAAPTNIDLAVGNAGTAAPWLAVACAAASLSAEKPIHMVLNGQGAHIDCAVLKSPGMASGAHAV